MNLQIIVKFLQFVLVKQLYTKTNLFGKCCITEGYKHHLPFYKRSCNSFMELFPPAPKKSALPLNLLFSQHMLLWQIADCYNSPHLREFRRFPILILSELK